MALTGSVVDTYRLQAPISAEWTSDAFTFCCWVTVDTQSSSREGIFHNYSAGGGGTFRLNVAATALNYFFRATTGDVSAVHTNANYTTGKRLFVYASVDSSGNGDIGNVFGGVNANQAIAGLAPINTPSTTLPTIMGNTAGTSSQKLLGKLEDFRHWSSRVSLADILEIEASHGRYQPDPDTLTSSLPLMEAAPGVDTDSAVPLDVAYPGRVWAVAGTGNATLWSTSLAPLRRSSR